jgi:hypothetical protein
MTEVEFLPHFPADWEPEAQRVSWPDLVTDSSQDETFLLVVPRGENTFDELIAKGGNRFSKYELQQPGWSESQVLAFRDQGWGFDAFPQTQTLFGLSFGGGQQVWMGPSGPSNDWPNIWWLPLWQTQPGASVPMSVEEGRIKGQSYGVDYSFLIGETGENLHAISPHWPFIKSYAEALVPRYFARWPNRLVIVCWNYLSDLPGTIRYGSRSSKKALLRLPLSSWPANHMLPGGNLELFNGVCLPVYLGSPDYTQWVPYEIAYKAKVAHKAGKKLVVVPQNMHEYNPNNKRLWELPEGGFYEDNKLTLDPSLTFAIFMFTRRYADAFAPFGFGGKDSRPFKLDPFWHDDGIWVPNGNGELEPGDPSTNPVWGSPEHTQEVFASRGTEDVAAFANQLYRRTFKLTQGGTVAFCEYRVDEGDWVVPSNSEADDIVDAWEDGGWVVNSQKKGTTVSFMVYNGKLGADAQTHKVEWKFEGVTYFMYMAGTLPYCANVNLA